MDGHDYTQTSIAIDIATQDLQSAESAVQRDPSAALNHVQEAVSHLRDATKFQDPETQTELYGRISKAENNALKLQNGNPTPGDVKGVLQEFRDIKATAAEAL